MNRRTADRRSPATSYAGDGHIWQPIAPDEAAAAAPGLGFVPARAGSVSWGAFDGARVVAMSVRWRGAGGVLVQLLRAGELDPVHGRKQHELAALSAPAGVNLGSDQVVLAPPYEVSQAEGRGAPYVYLVVGPDTVVDSVTLYEQLAGDAPPRLQGHAATDAAAFERLVACDRESRKRR